MSRRPKPTAIKELEGNPGGRALNKEEPKAERGFPEMPRGLSLRGRREWKYITRQLDTLGVLAVTDGKALAMYCDAYSDWEEANKKCHEDGMWYSEPVLNSEGMVVGQKHKQSPWFNVKVTAMKVMKSFLIEYGLTPASRTKLKIEKKPEGEQPGVLSRGDKQPDAPSPIADDEPNLDDIDETTIM